MPEMYRGYDLNIPKDKQWGQRENALHKQLIDKILDNPIDSLMNTVHVAVNGNNLTANGSIAKPFATINAAILSITDNSISNPYCISVAGGVFRETGTITVGEGIHIKGTGDSTIILTTTNDDDLFYLKNQSDLSKLTITGPTNAKTVKIIDPNSIVSLREIKFFNCAYPIYIDTENGNVNMFSIALRGNSISIVNAIEILNGDANLYTLTSIGTIGNTIINANGEHTQVHIWGIDNESANIDNILTVTNGANVYINDSRSNASSVGIYVNNAFLKMSNIDILNSNIGVDVGPDGTTYLILESVYVEDSIEWDLRIQNPTSLIGGMNNYLRDSKIEFTNGTPSIAYALNHFSNDLGDESNIIKAELAVGAPDRPSESSFGEGNSYTRGMLVYQYDTVNGFVNVTTEAKSFSGSTFGFSNTYADSAIYMSTTLTENNTYIKFFGCDIKINSQGNIGTGSVITEYWNGSIWTSFASMKNSGESPFYPTTESIINLPSGSYHVRFNARINHDWAMNDPIGLGYNTYWIRLRIVSAIISSPIIEQVKIHSNRSSFNSDGWVEFYGKARPIARLPWNYGMLQPAVSSPGDQDHFLSDTLDVGKIENAFANNTVDRIGFLAPIPFDLDTSTPIKLRWAVRYSDNIGDVNWNIRWGYSTSSDIIYTSQTDAPTTHSTQQLLTLSETVPTTIGQIKWSSIDIAVNNMNPRNSNGTSDILWLTIERDGTADSFNGIAGLVAITGDYLQWTIGGHLSYT